MNTEPRVSVIMIFLNAEKFIGVAIESVFAQTYDNWELLLVDDGSTDRSTDIALGYVQQYPEKVRYLEHGGHRNKGMSPSRNVGIAHAQGEFIALLDSDDVWLPEKLEKQVAIMEQHPEVGLVFNALLHLYDDGPRDLQPATLSLGKNLPGVWVSKMLESDDNGACPSSVLMRKSPALAVGGFEESFRGMFQLFEDQAMWNKVGLHAIIYFDPEPLVLYRMHPASWWGESSYYEQQFARIHLYAWLLKYIKTNNRKYLKELYAAKKRFYLILVRYLVDMDQIEAAAALISSLEQEITESPKDGEWNYLAAFCLHRMKINLQEALARYNRALEHGFDEFWVRYNRGSLHVHLGNVEQARSDLQRAVELKPAHQGAHLLLQQLLQKEKE